VPATPDDYAVDAHVEPAVIDEIARFLLEQTA
jgi:hypothetical protein